MLYGLHSERPQRVGQTSIGVMSLFGLSGALVVYAIVAPRWLGPVYERLGSDLAADASVAEIVGFQLWLASVPIAVILAVVGGALGTRSSGFRAWTFGLGGVALLIVPLVIGGVLGRTYGWLFGTGGTLIAVLALATIWHWSTVRSGLSPGRRLASDLRMAGYMGFAFAAWFTCGVFTLPVYALDVDKMISLNTAPVAMSMAYAMMAFFVIGWTFTLAAQLQDRRQEASPIDRRDTRQLVATQ